MNSESKEVEVMFEFNNKVYADCRQANIELDYVILKFSFVQNKQKF